MYVFYMFEPIPLAGVSMGEAEMATHARHSVAAASGQILLHSAALHTLLQLSTCSEEVAATP
jgi:hypothetical protein